MYMMLLLYVLLFCFFCLFLPSDLCCSNCCHHYWIFYCVGSTYYSYNGIQYEPSGSAISFALLFAICMNIERNRQRQTDWSLKYICSFIYVENIQCNTHNDPNVFICMYCHRIHVSKSLDTAIHSHSFTESMVRTLNNKTIRLMDNVWVYIEFLSVLTANTQFVCSFIKMYVIRTYT